MGKILRAGSSESDGEWIHCTALCRVPSKNEKCIECMIRRYIVICMMHNYIYRHYYPPRLYKESKGNSRNNRIKNKKLILNNSQIPRSLLVLHELKKRFQISSVLFSIGYERTKTKNNGKHRSTRNQRCSTKLLHSTWCYF